ncbi:MAG TPA: ABC-F family ATPase [Lachnoclostridium sp.]|nr:ABC-F family ATPase [Lachnoclostridium sp.]
MISAHNVTLRLGKKALFEEVNIKFTEGNCYGMIGANGAGKSTFLKILSGELEPTNGDIVITPGQRLSFLKQDHFKYDGFQVLDTVIMGNARLYEIMKEKDAIYMKEDFTDEDGIKAADLEGEFATMNGWEAESDAANLLNGLGIDTDLHYKYMSELNGAEKVKVLLAQALFGNPDILLLDEPTNHLDLDAIAWLEEFLINFENTVIVVSHDRHFLNKVCTHMADLDFSKIKLYVGNYDFWLESSQLATKLQAQSNAKKEEQIKELQDFIARFSANASKSKQATSRKKMLDKITLDDIQPSSRRYPFVGFTPEREIGNDLLQVENVSVTIDGKKILDNISFNLTKDDKVAFIADSDITTTTLFKVIMGEITPDTGSVRWGVTTSQAYLPKDNSKDFEEPLTILDWLRQFAGKEEDDNTFLRSFLGRMLFSGEEVLKPVNVLSGGEKVRVMLSKLMLSKANVLVLDDPTNHLDLESITALNDGLMAFTGSILFASHDHQFIQTLANRIIAVSDKGVIDRAETTYDEFLENPEIQKQMDVLFSSDY